MTSKELILKKKLLVIIPNLIFVILFFVNVGEAKMMPIIHHGKLILQNEPKIGQIAIIKVIKTAGYDDLNAEFGCFFPEGLEFINDKGYRVSFVEPPLSLGKGLRVIFYSGPVKKGEVKEAIFKVRILDDKKYIIVGGGPYDPEGRLEIDLGDPEPPEWKPKLEKAFTIDGKKYFPGEPRDHAKVGERSNELIEMEEDTTIRPASVINEYFLSGIKRLKGGKSVDLILPAGSLPPLRTELKIRTKDRPSYNYYREVVLNPQIDKDTSIPVRYLVYTEEETPQVKVTLILPRGFELVEEKSFKMSSLVDGRKEALLYSGPMRSKQCKAFYFKVKAFSGDILATTELTTIDGKKLIKEDKLTIDLSPTRL